MPPARLCLASLLAFTLSAVAAQAADLQITVTNMAGAPVRDAVVTAKPSAGGWAVNSRTAFTWNYEMVQHNIIFDPHVLVVPTGAEVTFPNRDKVRHHVYSFSPAKTFEIKLYGREENRKVLFDKAGVVSLGCNIHDGMIAYVFVSDTVHVAKTGADGVAVLRGLPAGAARVAIWQPKLRAPGGQKVQSVTLPAQGLMRQTVAVNVRP
ncbi:MAG: methylamine utilization protein [Phenylobacterium sp.]|jgi:plastocyanin|nr:methylamine utilization protein [Phenylobacterium sp.]MDZ4322448.1 methylamine utilization protein [Phenylobacterium sp.]